MINEIRKIYLIRKSSLKLSPSFDSMFPNIEIFALYYEDSGHMAILRRTVRMHVLNLSRYISPASNTSTQRIFFESLLSGA